MLLAPIAMHVPDGFFSVPTSVVLWVISIGVIGYSLLRAGEDLGEKQVPLMGALAAAIFAGQMLNFPVAGGTSGHLMGAALATILLGPWAAILVMTSVVSIQALMFQDGGLLALGGNIFNMGIIGVAVTYFIYRTVQRFAGKQSWGVFVGGALSGWLSIMIASLAVALQLAISGSSRANVVLPAMAGVHIVIGIGEALITVGALAFIYTTRRDLLKLGEAPPKGGKLVWIGGMAIALLLAILSPIASADPDGLEWVAKQNGFFDKAEGPGYSIIPDYAVPGVQNGQLATILAGIIGVIVVFGVAFAVAYTRRKRQSPSA